MVELVSSTVNKGTRRFMPSLRGGLKGKASKGVTKSTTPAAASTTVSTTTNNEIQAEVNEISTTKAVESIEIEQPNQNQQKEQQQQQPVSANFGAPDLNITVSSNKDDDYIPSYILAEATASAPSSPVRQPPIPTATKGIPIQSRRPSRETMQQHQQQQQAQLEGVNGLPAPPTQNKTGNMIQSRSTLLQQQQQSQQSTHPQHLIHPNSPPQHQQVRSRQQIPPSPGLVNENDDTLPREVIISRMSISQLIASKFNDGEVSTYEKRRREIADQKRNERKRLRRAGSVMSMVSESGTVIKEGTPVPGDDCDDNENGTNSMGSSSTSSTPLPGSIGSSANSSLNATPEKNADGVVLNADNNAAPNPTILQGKRPSLANENDPMAPKVRIVDGVLTIDNSSLLVGGGAQANEGEDDEFRLNGREEDQDRHVTSATYGRQSRGSRWTKKDTDDFFTGLQLFGTNFDMITKIIFPRRARREVKKKFNKEEKSNPHKVTFMLRKRLTWDAEKFKDFPGAKDMDRTLRGVTPGISSNASDSMPLAFERGSESPGPSRATTPALPTLRTAKQPEAEPVAVEENQEEEVDEEDYRNGTPEDTLRPTAEDKTAMDKLQTSLKVSMSSSTVKRSGMFKVNAKAAKKQRKMTSITAADLEENTLSTMNGKMDEAMLPTPASTQPEELKQIPTETNAITPPITEPSSITTSPISMKQSLVPSGTSTAMSTSAPSSRTGSAPASPKPTQPILPALLSPSKETTTSAVLDTTALVEKSTTPAIVTAGVKKAGVKSMFKPKAKVKK